MEQMEFREIKVHADAEIYKNGFVQVKMTQCVIKQEKCVWCMAGVLRQVNEVEYHLCSMKEPHCIESAS